MTDRMTDITEITKDPHKHLSMNSLFKYRCNIILNPNGHILYSTYMYYLLSIINVLFNLTGSCDNQRYRIEEVTIYYKTKRKASGEQQPGGGAASHRNE